MRARKTHKHQILRNAFPQCSTTRCVLLPSPPHQRQWRATRRMGMPERHCALRPGLHEEGASFQRARFQCSVATLACRFGCCRCTLGGLALRDGPCHAGLQASAPRRRPPPPVAATPRLTWCWGVPVFEVLPREGAATFRKVSAVSRRPSAGTDTPAGTTAGAPHGWSRSSGQVTSLLPACSFLCTNGRSHTKP